MRREVNEFRNTVTHNGESIEVTLRESRHSEFEREIGNDGHKVCITRAFAVTVDGALNLRCTADDGRYRVCNSAARIVLSVNAHARCAANKRNDLGSDSLHLVWK